MIFWIWTLIITVVLTGTQGNRFVKEYVTVQEEPKSDYRCKGYVLINDLKLLLCENKQYNYSSDGLVVSVNVEAGSYDEPEGFDGVATLVMRSIFHSTNLTKTNLYDETSTDECSISGDSTSFNFYQNATTGKDKLHGLVQQLKNIKFESKFINNILDDNDEETTPEGVTVPTARDKFRYDSYANAFRGRKLVENGSEKITDKKLIFDEVINFYERHYSSDRTLVVLSQTNIYRFEEKYMELLSMIPKRNCVESSSYKIGYEIMMPNERILELYFPLRGANVANEASYKYLQYYFFNTKISNGFEWMLTESGLANEVSTSCSPTSWSSKDVVFGISIKLTENGLKNTSKVLKLIFSYLNRIKSKKIEKWVHDEVAKSMDPYASKTQYDLIEWLSDVTKRASKYGLKDSLVGAPKFFDVDMIRSMLNKLNVNNFNCLHGVPAKGVSDAIQMVAIPRGKLDKLQTIRLREADAVEMPLKNLILEGQPCTSMPEEFELPEEYAGPPKRLLLDQPGKKLWFVPTQPHKAATYILLAFVVRLPKETFSNVKAYANFMLMIKSLNLLVNQELLAKMSNIGCYNLLINYHHTGIEVLIYASPENVNFIVDNIFHVLAHKRVTKGVLNKARKALLTFYNYEDFSWATYKNLFHTVRSIDDRMIEALKDVTTNSVESMLKVLPRRMAIEALVVAEIDEKAAKNMYNKVVRQFENYGSIVTNVNINWRKVLQLETGSTYLYETKQNKLQNGVNIALIVYQCNVSSMEMMAYTRTFSSFYHDFLSEDISNYSKNAGVEISLLKSKDGSIVFAVKGPMAPGQLEAILEKFVQEKLEMTLVKFAAEKNHDLLYYFDSSDLIEQLKDPSLTKEKDFNANFPNTLDMVKTYRTVLDARSKQHKKLAIYFYATGNEGMMKATLPQNVKLVREVEKFRSEHRFVRYL